MDSLRSYLLSDKNIAMLESIILDRLYDTTGISLNKRDSKFQQSMMLVITTVIRNELHLQNTFDQKTLLKMNNIFIKETVKYLTELLTYSEEEEQEFTSKLSEEDYIDTPPIEVEEIQEVQVEKKLEEIYYFDEKSTSVQLENVISLGLVNLTIDYSGYVVNETNCNLCIDNIEYKIPHGNYSPYELLEYLSSLEKTLDFLLEEKTETVSIHIIKEKERKSMSGAIKDKENQKQVNVNFGVKNSMAKLLGFLEKTYIIKDTPIYTDSKHLIKHPSYADFIVTYSKELKEEHRVFFNCKYNETVHYIPILSKQVKTSPVAINNISIMSDYNSNRPFHFTVKITKCF